MRKVHQEVLNAVHFQKNMRRGNYEVRVCYDAGGMERGEPSVADVYLFHNHIARWHYERGHERSKLTINPVVCSATTKGILHELLVELSYTMDSRPTMRLYQRQYQWYLESDNGPAGEERIVVDSSDVIQIRWSNACNCWLLDRKGCELSAAA